jgi:LCP family protein required for cell wall assembly
LFGYGFLKTRNIFKGDGDGAAALQQNVDPARLNGEGDGRVNILLVGKGGPGETAPDLTDSLLLASIDPIQNEASLVSVPRDLYVQDSNGYSTKINAIYSNAKQARLSNGDDTDSDREAAEDSGLNAIKDTVSEVLGVPVHYYVMVDFKAFEDAINTVGGLTIDVKEPLYDQSVAWLLGGNPLVADEGLQTMDGKRALLYARSRKGSARGDFDRTERQREIIVALQQEILSANTYSNPFKVVELLNTFGDRVRTDLNGLGEIKRLYEIGQKIGSDKIGSVGLADPPNILVRTDFINSQSVVVPSAGLYQYDEIHSFVRNNLRDAFLKSEDARVIILNGTDIAGLAGATSDELKSYGYNVVSVDNAPTTEYVSNQLFDLTDGKLRYTKSYIERRLGLQSTTIVPPGIPDISQADFVIILGTNEATKTTN